MCRRRSGGGGGGGGSEATLRKVCFLSSGWPELWPVGRLQNPSSFFFFFFRSLFSVFFFFFTKTIFLTERKKVKKKVADGSNDILARPLHRKLPFLRMA